MLENTEGAIKKNGQSRETGNIGYTRWRKTKQRQTQYTQTNINNVNKTWALLQTTRGKDEANIVLLWKPQRTTQHGTQNVTYGKDT